MRPSLLVADVAARAFTLLPAETAHRAAVAVAERGLAPKPLLAPDPRLQMRVAGLAVSHPLGLAAGFDKDARCPGAMLDLGFSFVEVGAITPRPQPGNPRPRIFRLRSDLAIVNRYGFNNEGLDAAAQRLAARERRGVVGVNLGANKDSADRVADYVEGVKRLAGLVGFYTVNVSSPNTPGLRALQDRAALDELLGRVISARDALAPKTPLFLKVAPDLADADKADIAAVAVTRKLDALIVSNTTIARPASLKSRRAREPGGLSGAPLFSPSTALLKEFRQALGRDVPLIGVGGIFSAHDAYAKILAGASLVQLYTALVYRGPGLVKRIVEDLPALLATDGFSRLEQAVGARAS